MRLTLRTLLAYLDDVLDPADKEELAQKIESSDFAKDLVHQTRDSVRRLRLSAPQLIGVGMGMDPNSVAEYLDNALPPEQVGDYERICLESDVHLAETAACHHVLTMVLGEPAEVEPRSRQRMYMIPAEARERRRLRAEPAHSKSALATTVAVVAPPTTVLSSAPARSMPATNAYEVPEYLRAATWSPWRTMLAALAAVLVVGAALYFIADRMGWPQSSPDVAAVDVDAQSPPNVSEQEPGPDVLQTETTPGAEPAPISPPPASTPSAPSETVSSQETGGTVQPLASSPSETTAAPDTTALPDAGAIAAATADQSTGIAAEPVPAENAATSTAAVEPAAPATIESPSADEPSAIVPPQAAATLDPATETVAPPTSPDSVPPENALPPTPADPLAAAPAATPDAATGAAEADLVPQGPPELGTYLSGKTVLLRFDQPKGGWFRVEPRSAVVAGERLLSLPEFRPQVTLASGVLLELPGGTQVVMQTADTEPAAGLAIAPAEVPLVEVLYGRMVLINTSNDENLLRVKVANSIGEARIKRNARLAIEVDRKYVPGNDPRTTPALLNVRMYAPDGGVTWKDASSEFGVDQASRWTLVAGGPAEVAADSEPPAWIDREPVARSSEQKYGAPKIEERLTSDRPAQMQLVELFHGNGQRELKSLAAKSAMHIGEFAPFIDTLRDAGQKWPTWRTHIETLRSIMAQNPESAESVFKALVDQRGRPAAGDLYEMLCGYNAEQIGMTADERKTGAIAQLIDWLEEDNLDYRVLAVYDLLEITGKQLMQNPAASPATRKINVQNWRKRLESGELEPVAPNDGKSE
jgi:hypothetical protein